MDDVDTASLFNDNAQMTIQPARLVKFAYGKKDALNEELKNLLYHHYYTLISPANKFV